MKNKSDPRRSLVKYSWGILVGMLALPILALMVKLYPRGEVAWEILMAAAGLLIVRSLIGYLFPQLGHGHKKHPDEKTAVASTPH